MADIQRRGGAQLERLLRRFGVTRIVAGPQISEDVQAVSIVPRVDLQCQGTANVAALAANRSQIQIFNPAGSGIIMILHRIWISTGAAGRVRLLTHNTALANAVTSLAVMERTLGNQPAPAGQMRSLQGAAVGTVVQTWELDIAARSYEFDLSRFGGLYDFEGPSLAEGRGLILSPSVDELAIVAGWMWTERLTEK